MNDLILHLEKIFADAPNKIVISKPNGNAEYRRVCIVKKGAGFQIEKYTDKQVFHENVSDTEAVNRCADFLSADLRQLNAWSDTREYSLAISKKGKVLFGSKPLSGSTPGRAPPKAMTGKRTISSPRISLFPHLSTWACSRKRAGSQSRCTESSVR